jgi:hypothetical protein
VAGEPERFRHLLIEEVRVATCSTARQRGSDIDQPVSVLVVTMVVLYALFAHLDEAREPARRLKAFAFVDRSVRC